MMASDPAVLLYTADFLVGVSDMPFLDRGYYITLLCLQHQKGHLSEETICFSLGLRSVTEISKVMCHFTQDENGLYFQKRMELETEKRCNFTKSRRENGEKGGRPKNHMDNHTDNHMGTHMGDGNDNENIDVIIDKKKGVKGGKETSFDVFWIAYPKKVGKDAAKKSFAKVKLDISVLLEAIEKQKKSEQWTKDGGQYIPNPATWLNQGRWEDELPEKKGGASNAGTDSTKQWARLNITKLG